MRFAESYSNWMTDKQNAQYYKLKYAAQLGEDIERIAFEYHDRENVRVNGLLSGLKNRYERNIPDRPYY